MKYTNAEIRAFRHYGWTQTERGWRRDDVRVVRDPNSPRASRPYRVEVGEETPRWEASAEYARRFGDMTLLERERDASLRRLVDALDSEKTA